MATPRFPSGLTIMLISRWSQWIAIYSICVDSDIHEGQSLDGQKTQEGESKGSDVDKEKADGENVKDPGPEQDEETNGGTLKCFITINIDKWQEKIRGQLPSTYIIYSQRSLVAWSVKFYLIWTSV